MEGTPVWYQKVKAKAYTWKILAFVAKTTITVLLN